MKRAVLGLAFCGALAVLGGMPELEPGVYLTNGSSRLSVAYTPAPTVLDWNNDGKKDLLVGQFTEGNVWLFLNQGTDQQPVFNGGVLLQDGPAPICTSYG